MSVHELEPGFSIAGQIRPEDLPAIARAGFRSVICNRPDGEEPGQPSFQAIAEAAQREGLQARHLPALTGRVTPAQGQALARLLQELPGPVLAYCRSGARSASMWTFARQLGGSAGGASSGDA